MKKQIIILLQKLQNLSGLSIRLTKLTGKSKHPIHPKHLIKKSPWYLAYLNKQDVLLDMGCDTGQHAIDSAKKVKRVIAFDLSKKTLLIAEKRAKDKKIKNIKFEIQNAEKKLTYKNNSFSAILCLDVLEHIKNESLAMEEIKRILKPKGKLFLSLPNKNTSWKKLQKSVGLFYYSDPDHKREYSKQQIKNLCKKYGFEVKFIEPVVLDTPLSGIFDLIGAFSLETYKIFGKWKKKKALENPEESVGFQIYAVNKKH